MSIQDQVVISKKAFADVYLGATVVGKTDIPLVEGVALPVSGVSYLVTGLSGIKFEGQLVDFDFVLESLDENGDQICMSMDEVQGFFHMPKA